MGGELTTPKAGPLQGRRALVVVHDSTTREWLAQELRTRGARVQTLATRVDGLAALVNRPALVVIDLKLPDGSGLEIAERAQKLRPLPRIVVTSSAADAEEGMVIGRMLVARLVKPVSTEQLDSVLLGDSSGAEFVRLAAARAVGRLGLVEARDLLSRSMLDQALELASGSKKGAASILKVARQSVQRRTREE